MLFTQWSRQTESPVFINCTSLRQEIRHSWKGERLFLFYLVQTLQLQLVNPVALLSFTHQVFDTELLKYFRNLTKIHVIHIWAREFVILIMILAFFILSEDWVALHFWTHVQIPSFAFNFSVFFIFHERNDLGYFFFTNVL